MFFECMTFITFIRIQFLICVEGTLGHLKDTNLRIVVSISFCFMAINLNLYLYVKAL